jgi:hypothetical protein
MSVNPVRETGSLFNDYTDCSVPCKNTHCQASQAAVFGALTICRVRHMCQSGTGGHSPRNAASPQTPGSASLTTALPERRATGAKSRVVSDILPLIGTT